jgi:hypothetical protein
MRFVLQFVRIASGGQENFVGSLGITIEKELTTLANKLSILDERAASETRREGGLEAQRPSTRNQSSTASTNALLQL